MLRLGGTQATRRAAFLAVLMALWAAGIAARLVYLQVVRHKHYQQLSEGQIRITEDS